MRGRQVVFAAVGIAAVGLGFGLAVAPGFVAVGSVERLVDTVAAVGTVRVLLVTGLGVVGYLAVGLRSPASSDDAGAFGSVSTETASGALAGGALDTAVDEAVTGGGESFVAVEQTLRETAVAVYADTGDCSRTAAERAVDRCEWCRDPLAAAVLSDRHSFPAAAQLRLFVLPERERRRRIDRTLAAIERLEEP